jgi:hypothetical protein
LSNSRAGTVPEESSGCTHHGQAGEQAVQIVIRDEQVGVGEKEAERQSYKLNQGWQEDPSRQTMERYFSVQEGR